MQSVKSLFVTRIKSFVPKSVLCFKEGYTTSTLKQDLTAGFAVGIIAFPLAMAYAIGAGISPEKGIFTAIIGGFLLSLLGGCRVQIGGPTSTFIVILHAMIAAKGFDNMVIAALMAGVILILFGFAGLGTFIKYIPYPVVTGLTTAIALTIVTSQLKDFLGLAITDMPIAFVDKWKIYWMHLHTWNPKATFIGLFSLAIILYFRKFRPQFPGAIVALGASALLTSLLNINVETIGSHYGELKCSLSMLHLPALSFDRIVNLIPDALTIALLIAIESLLSAVVAEGMTGFRHNSNTELFASGVANIGAILFGGIPGAGALARTAANVKNGAKTPVAGMTHSLTILFIMLIFGPLVSKIPLAALSSVLFVIAWGMTNFRHFFHLFSAPRKDVLVLITVFFVTLFVNITVAVQVGTILAAFLFMKQMSDLSDVISKSELFNELEEEGTPLKTPSPGVEIYEINGPFFFGVADRLKNLLMEIEKPPKTFILEMSKVPAIDASGMHALEEFYHDCARQGTKLILSGVRAGPLRDLKRYQLDHLIKR